MTNPGDIERRLNPSAIKKGVTWGTEVDVNAAGNGILPLNAGVPALKQTPVEDETASGAFETFFDFTDIAASEFSLDFDHRYLGLENMLLAMLTGSDPTPVRQTELTAYLHTLAMINTTTGIFGTYATAKHTKIHIVPSFKVLKGTFSMNKGLLKSSFSLRGNKVIDTSAIITAMAAVTVSDIYNRVKFNQGVFRMNAAQSGGALAAPTDVIGVKGFQLEIERKMDSERTNQAAYIIEPRENDKPTVKLTLDFARMDDANAAYFATWIAETEKKADITFTGAQIGGLSYNYLKFEFPRLKIEDVDYPDGNIIPAKMVLRGLLAASAPTGMTAVNPVHPTLMNKRATSYLA
jgi:hypothetical protein